MRNLPSALHEKLDGLLKSMGYELIGGEQLSQGKHSVLRIYIDSEKGVTIDDCSTVSQQLSAMLDVEDPLAGRYFLEVSSPGVDRPLYTLAQLEKQQGKTVKLKLSAPINKRRQYTGTLTRVEGDQIYLLEDGLTDDVAIAFSAIEKANVVGEVGFKRSK